MSKDFRKKKQRTQKERPEFDQTIVDLARVTRVTKGGKQLTFRALILIGNRKGKVGYGIQKGKDVQIAVDKAVTQAHKNIITVPFDDETIPHRVEAKFKAAKVMIKPAPQGSGIIAGSAIRTVLELAGVPNASAKMLGKSNNKMVNVMATFEALSSFRPHAVESINKKKSQPVQQKKVQRDADAKKVDVAPEKKGMAAARNKTSTAAKPNTKQTAQTKKTVEPTKE